MLQIAAQTGISRLKQPAPCRHGDPRLPELEQLAQALHMPATYFVAGTFNQAGNGSTQKIKIGKAAAHELVAQLGVCRLALEQSRELVAAKDEIISLLRGRL